MLLADRGYDAGWIRALVVMWAYAPSVEDCEIVLVRHLT
jgi:hypothetical protein